MNETLEYLVVKVGKCYAKVPSTIAMSSTQLRSRPDECTRWPAGELEAATRVAAMLGGVVRKVKLTLEEADV